MKKIILTLAAVTMAIGCYAFPKALYVKKGDSFTKFNFGVAADLKFSEDGRYLNITGYNESIDLNEIDYITFTAPVSTTALTPDQQKERLITVSDKVNQMVDPEKEADIINIITDFLADGGEEETSQGWIWHKPVSEFGWPEGFWSEKTAPQAVTGLLKAAQSAAGLDLNSGAPLLSSMLKVYRFADYTGVFGANHTSQQWEKTNDVDYLELRYLRYKSSAGGYYAVRLEASDDYWSLDTSDFNSRIPRKLTLSFLRTGNKVGTVTIDFDILQNDHINADIHFKGNVVEAKTSIKINDSAIEAKALSYIDGKYLNDSYMKVDGFGFMDYDQMKEDYKAAQDTEDPDTWQIIEGDIERLSRHFYKVQAETDVINELQGYGYLFDFKDYINTSDKAGEELHSEEFTYPDGYTTTYWPYYYIGMENGIIDLSRSKEDDYTALSNYLNRKSDIQFAYDKSGNTQGFATWEVTDDPEEYTVSTNSEGIPYYGYYIKDGKAFYIGYCEEYEYPESTPGSPNHEPILHRFYGVSEYIDGKLVIHQFPKESLVFPTVGRCHYYSVTPKLVFSDLTGFYFGDFFTSQAFSGPISHYNRIIDAFYTITGLERSSSDK